MKCLCSLSRIALLIFIIPFLFKNPSLGQELPLVPGVKTIEVDVEASVYLPVKQIKRFLVLNPQIATARIISPLILSITGRSRGTTFIHIWDERDLWTVRVKVERKEIRLALLEKLRVKEELLIMPTLKLDYAPDFRIHKWGVDIGRLKRVSGVHTHRFSLHGPTPYGRIDSLIYLERRDILRRKEREVFYGERNLTFKLLEANVGPFRNFDLIVGDNFLVLCPLIFPGRRFRGLTYGTSGHLLREGLDHDRLSYTLFWGHRRLGGMVGIPVGMPELEVRDYLFGSRFDYQLDEGTRVFTTFIKRYGEPLVGRSDAAVSAGVSLERGILSFAAEGAYSQGSYGITLSSGVNFERWSAAVGFRDIQECFFTPVGPAPGQGILGLSFTAHALPFEHLRLWGGLDYFQNRRAPNPLDPERFNLIYNIGAGLTLPRGLLFTTSYGKSDMTGSAFPSRSDRFNFRVSRLFSPPPFFLKSLRAYLHYETRKSQNLIWPERDYRNRKKEVGLTASLPGGFFITTSYQYNWLEELYYDIRTHPRQWRSSVNFSRKLFGALSLSAYLSYTDAEGAQSPFSHIPYEDRIEGGVRLNWRISPTANTYFGLHLREHRPEVSGADDHTDMRVYLGGRIQFDTLIRVEPRGRIRGVVFRDLDGDGLRDVDEPGIGGVKVHMGELTTITDAQGNYSFPRVRGKVVTVMVDALTLPYGFIYTTPGSVEVTIEHRETMEVNFGIMVRTEIRGIVFCDTNENMIFDAKDFGLEGVILLLQTGQMARTDRKGRFLLEELPPGPNELWIEVMSIPVGYFPVGPIRLEIYLVEGRTERIDLPLIAHRTIMGYVFLDLDGDFIFDVDEKGIEGVKVYMNGLSTLTDERGRYIFTDLKMGDYIIRIDLETLPEGLLPTQHQFITITMPPPAVSKRDINFPIGR